MLLREPRGRRLKASRRLSRADSIRLLENIKGLLPKSRGRAQALSELFGCSYRTARRLLNTEANALPQLKRDYLDAAVVQSGHSATHLLRREPKESSEVHLAVGRLERAEVSLDVFREMASLAAVMAARCCYGHGLPVSYGVEVNVSCEPTHMYLDIRRSDGRCGEVHRISVRRVYSTGRWLMQYLHPRLGKQFEGALSENNLERLLKHVNS